jgi:hypothetical protein
MTLGKNGRRNAANQPYGRTASLDERGACLAAWRRLGYPEDMGSATIVWPPPLEFRRVYHFTSSARAKLILKSQRLKVTRFSEANDPFERLGLDCHRAATPQHTASRDETTGILCFSENWNHPLLWSHYGDRHQGICLGFDVRRGDLQQVQYADERLREQLPEEDLFPERIPPELQSILSCTKYSDLQYEQEFRRFVALAGAHTEVGNYYWPFGADLRLREVIFGDRCGAWQTRGGFEALCPDATMFKAKLGRRGFAVVLDGTTRPVTSDA